MESARPTSIILPLYKNVELFYSVFESLVICNSDISSINADLIIINDSPDDIALAAAIQSRTDGFNLFSIILITNTQNIGFLKSVNKGLLHAVSNGRDAIILNSDTQVFEGIFQEIQSVAYSDEMIGFVSPRSNNATICTSPSSPAGKDLSPEVHAARHAAFARMLPRITYAPTAVGFCMLIKYDIIANFGVFDETYGNGYNEENDLVLRANRRGFRAALANWAFVWHQGEASFSTTGSPKTRIEGENHLHLVRRYPEYPQLLNEYLTSPRYRAEHLVAAAVPNTEGRITIAFDLSGLHAAFNGTASLAKHLLWNAAEHWPDNIELVVLCDIRVWRFHQFGRCPRVVRRDLSDLRPVAALLKVGQPFGVRSLDVGLRSAAATAIMMLDTIAHDIGLLRVDFDQEIWSFALDWTDLIVANSEFTKRQIERRFSSTHDTKFLVSPHSYSTEEYRDVSKIIGFDPPAGYILVVGNKFSHKGVSETVDFIRDRFPQYRLVALGALDQNVPNVVNYESGHLEQSKIDGLFAGARLVIFPSYYEGFGFPLMEAIARGKPIFCRPLPPLLEAVDQLTEGAENVHLYSNHDELGALLSDGIPAWIGGRAVGEQAGWERSAMQLLDGILASIRTVSLAKVEARLRYLDLFLDARSSDKSSHGQRRIIARTGTALEACVKFVLREPAVNALGRRIWHVAKLIHDMYLSV